MAVVKVSQRFFNASHTLHSVFFFPGRFPFLFGCLRQMPAAGRAVNCVDLGRPGPEKSRSKPVSDPIIVYGYTDKWSGFGRFLFI